MRRPWVLAIVLAAIGAGSLVLAASLVKRTQSFSLGVLPAAPVAELRPQQTLCQGPIDVVGEFDRVTLTLGTFMRPGPPLAVRVRDVRTRTTIASGGLERGYRDNSAQQVRVGRVGEDRSIDVCVTNRGTRRVATYGSAGEAHVPSTATVAGKDEKVDAAMSFEFDRPRSLLSLAPRMVQRATLFAPSWISGGVLWTLFALVALAVPLLLARAFAGASACSVAGGSAPGAAPAEPQAPAPVDA